MTAVCTGCKCLPEIATGAKRPRNDKSGAFAILTAVCTGCKCLPEIATGAKRPRNDKSGAFAILTAVCTDYKCVAGSGMPLPYIGRYRFNGGLLIAQALRPYDP